MTSFVPRRSKRDFLEREVNFDPYLRLWSLASRVGERYLRRTFACWGWGEPALSSCLRRVEPCPMIFRHWWRTVRQNPWWQCASVKAELEVVGENRMFYHRICSTDTCGRIWHSLLNPLLVTASRTVWRRSSSFKWRRSDRQWHCRESSEKSVVENSCCQECRASRDLLLFIAIEWDRRNCSGWTCRIEEQESLHAVWHSSAEWGLTWPIINEGLLWKRCEIRTLLVDSMCTWKCMI